MGRVVHFEIYAENPDRAIDFYSKIFDWKLNKWEGPPWITGLLKKAVKINRE